MPRFDHTEHVRLMMDIMVLSFWTDSTRDRHLHVRQCGEREELLLPRRREAAASTRSRTTRTTPQNRWNSTSRINVWHMQQYAYMLEKMKGIDEGGKSLLSNSMVLCGSPLRDGNKHEPRNVPTVLAGQGGGTVKTGRHLEFGQRHAAVQPLGRDARPRRRAGEKVRRQQRRPRHRLSRYSETGVTR